MPALPQMQKALVLTGKGTEFQVATVDVPKPVEPGELLVKVLAVSLNPVDWMIQEGEVGVPSYPSIIGFDPAGDVVELGKGVEGVSVGDKVFCQAVLDNRRAGYQQYTIARHDVIAKIPSNKTYDEVATFPCAGGAAYLGLFDETTHGLNISNPLSGEELNPPHSIVLLGAGSTVGQYAVQFAKLAGISNIIVTASKSHESHLLQLGATHVIDRTLPANEIKKNVAKVLGEHQLSFVFDTISLEETQRLGYDLLPSTGGVLEVTLEPKIPAANRVPNKQIRMVSVLRDGGPDNIPAMKLLYPKLHDLFGKGKLVPPPHDVLPGGLTGVPSGLKKMRRGEVIGKKLVVHPQETP